MVDVKLGFGNWDWVRDVGAKVCVNRRCYHRCGEEGGAHLGNPPQTPWKGLLRL